MQGNTDKIAFCVVDFEGGIEDLERRRQLVAMIFQELVILGVKYDFFPLVGNVGVSQV